MCVIEFTVTLSHNPSKGHNEKYTAQISPFDLCKFCFHKPIRSEKEEKKESFECKLSY